MHGISLLLIAVIGVDVGWQPTEEGDLEYIIQIAPEQLRSLKAGDVIEVGVRPMLRPVRRYRIIIGNDPLPRETARPESGVSPPTLVPSIEPEATPDTGLPPPTLSIPQQGNLDSTRPDHSIVVPPQDSAEGDTRWVAAAELPGAAESQSIPTQPIPPPPPNAEATPGSATLPPPPPIAPLTPPLKTLPPPPLKTLPRENKAFVPDYRRQTDATEEAQNEYQIGDSVPVRETPQAEQGIVPPTQRLDLPPPPETASSPPPLRLPPPPEIPGPPPSSDFDVSQTNLETPDAADLPSVIKKEEEEPAIAPIEVKEPAASVAAAAAGGTNADHQPAQGTSGSIWLLLILFASIGGNIYLSYVTWDIRKRFLATFMKSSSASGPPEHPSA